MSDHALSNSHAVLDTQATPFYSAFTVSCICFSLLSMVWCLIFIVFFVNPLRTFRLDYGKKRGHTKEERERERLKHKYKKEFKGALRELRKDTRFLAQAKLSDTMNRLVWDCLSIWFWLCFFSQMYRTYCALNRYLGFLHNVTVFTFDTFQMTTFLCITGVGKYINIKSLLENQTPLLCSDDSDVTHCTLPTTVYYNMIHITHQNRFSKL